MCVLNSFGTFVGSIYHSKKYSDIIMNVYKSSCQVTTILIRF